ncbi:hypothetical protein Esi_0075_0080 [Ectocarpus siliculosus]|uniref:Uncharacterized protein n=1 Tax=Ectocarpus siliculosus TaxID=2880 RepID=D7G6K4_ECTSI|nr:hypothetical protein Esi_0075_0080 [Ectocarpus siliculosus]|eukprot:CBJ27589.1 hypothetical protein Esi_0075_0080 [Ectocarpus siliculosus]
MILRRCSFVLSREFGVPFKGFLWLLVLTVQCVSSQYCQTDVVSLTGTEFGNEYTFECVEGAYVSEVTLSSETNGFTGFILTCSDGEVSEIFGYCFYRDTLFVKVYCTGGWTQLSTTPSLDTDSPANASFFCFNDGGPSGATLGPYPAIDEASCPAPDGLLVPGTTGTTDDVTDDLVNSSPTPGPMSESPTEPTPEPTPAPVSIPTPEPTSEPTTKPTPEPTPSPVSIPTSEPTSEPTTEPTTEPAPQPTPTPVSITTPEPTSEPTADPIPEPTPAPVLVQTSKPTLEPTAEPSPESMPTPASIPTPEPTDINPVGQPHSLTSSPLRIAAPATYTGDEALATTPTPVGSTMTPTSSPSPIATSATETEDDASATTQNPVGPTLTPTPGVLQDADDDNDDGSNDDSIWTETGGTGRGQPEG